MFSKRVCYDQVRMLWSRILISIFFVWHSDNQRTLWNRSIRAITWLAKNPPNSASFMSQSYNLDQEARAEIMAHAADCDIGQMQMVDRPYQSSLTCFMMLVMVVMLILKQVQREKEILSTVGSKLYVRQTISFPIEVLWNFVENIWCSKCWTRRKQLKCPNLSSKWKQMFISVQFGSLGIVAGSEGIIPVETVWNAFHSAVSDTNSRWDQMGSDMIAFDSLYELLLGGY